MPTSEQCPICIENMPKSRRFECPFCEHVACKSCVKRYILNTADDPNCMNCHRLFDREILGTCIAQTFVNKELKTHREAVLLERETAMMPATQPYVTQELQRRENMRLLRTMQEKRTVLKRQINQLDRGILELQRQIVPPLETERRQFVHRCAQDGCRGFLSNAWKCNTCNRYTCSECNAPRGTEREDEHVCQEADKQTMQMIKNDSKKCPGCGEFIFKVSGCDQMWCTSCHTAFSWRSGAKINGNIHNPHFYEFQRTTRAGPLREHGDIPCGGMPSYRELIDNIRKSKRVLPQTDMDVLANIHRLTMHIDLVDRPRYDTGELNEQSNLDLRISYMLNEMTSAVFKEKLQQREKKMLKKRDIGLVLQMYVHTIGDMLRQAILSGEFAARTVDIIALIDYTNTTLANISQKYSCVVPSINKTHMRVVQQKF